MGNGDSFSCWSLIKVPPSLGIIGFGQMAKALVTPLLEKGQLSLDHLMAVVGRSSTVERLQAEMDQSFSCVPADDPKARDVWSAPVQLLSVKPQQLDVVAAAAPHCMAGQESLLISVLAGVSLDRLMSAFPGRQCVRAVPNTPALVAAGLTGLAWGEGVTETQQRWVQNFFQPVSEVFEIPEYQLDAFLALTSSGPAYVSMITEAMADGAVASGLPRKLARHLANQTLAGTAELLSKRDLHPGQLKDMVSSPGGTTITGLRQLERAGLRSALIEAVIVAAERSRELG